MIMISKRLQNLFLISIPLFIAHGLEEYFTGFYNTDSIFYFVFQPFGSMSVFQATFLLFQIMIWILLIVSYLILSRRMLLKLLTFLGLIFVFELSHLIKALISWNYYPGLITGLLFPIIGFFYWKELIKNWISHVKKN